MSRLTELRSIHDNTSACQVEKQQNDKAHGHQHRPNKPVGDKAAKSNKVANSKTGGSKHQPAVQKQKPRQHSDNFVYKQLTANEVTHMKNRNFSKQVVNMACKWVASAVLVAVMTATNVDVAL